MHKRLIALIATIIVALMLVSCKGQVKAQSIFVVALNQNQEVSSFNFDDYLVEVTFSNQTKQQVPLNKHMVSLEDVQTLTQAGSHKILVSYLGLTTYFIVNINQAPTLKEFNFGVISAVCGTANLKELLVSYKLNDIKNLIFLGNFLSGLSWTEFDEFNNTISAVYDTNLPNIFYVLGENEIFLPLGVTQSDVYKKLNSTLNQSQANFVSSINGFDFIFISGGVGGYIDDELKQNILTWLCQVSSAQPFFVCFGYGINSYGGQILTNILKDYDNAVLITADKESYKSSRNINVVDNIKVIKCGIAQENDALSSFKNNIDKVNVIKSQNAYTAQNYGYVFYISERVEVDLLFADNKKQSVCEVFKSDTNYNLKKPEPQQEEIQILNLDIDSFESNQTITLKINIKTNLLAEGFMVTINQNQADRFAVFNSGLSNNVLIEFTYLESKSFIIEFEPIDFSGNLHMGLAKFIEVSCPIEKPNDTNLIDGFIGSTDMFDYETTLSGKSIKLEQEEYKTSELVFSAQIPFDLNGKILSIAVFNAPFAISVEFELQVGDVKQLQYSVFYFEEEKIGWQVSQIDIALLEDITFISFKNVLSIKLSIPPSYLNNAKPIYFDSFLYY